MIDSESNPKSTDPEADAHFVKRKAVAEASFTVYFCHIASSTDVLSIYPYVAYYTYCILVGLPRMQALITIVHEKQYYTLAVVVSRQRLFSSAPIARRRWISRVITSTQNSIFSLLFIVRLLLNVKNRAANLNSKELDHFAELELEKIFILNSNLNSLKTVRVH